MIRGWTSVWIVAVLGFTAAACADERSDLAIVVDKPVALADTAITITIIGVKPGIQVDVRAHFADAESAQWSSQATFVATGSSVDLAKQAPVSGSYQVADAMGLFWSMATTAGHENDRFTAPGAEAFIVTLAATAGGKSVSTTITRRVTGENVSHTDLRPDGAGFHGTYFNPPVSASPLRPAVLTFGGSEGGAGSGVYVARYLAAHGFPALGIGYFGETGLPSTLDSIPLEYFAKALTWLRGRPGIDPNHVWVMGASRGSEAALLTAAHFPALANGVIVGSPSAVVISALGDSPTPVKHSAWTLGGQPLPYLDRFATGVAEDPQAKIPVELIRGPVLTIAGQDDHLWPSYLWAEEIMARLDSHHVSYPHRNLSYPDAGHNVDAFIPYRPVVSKVQTRYGTLDLGGSPTVDTRALADAWPRILTFLANPG